MQKTGKLNRWINPLTCQKKNLENQVLNYANESNQLFNLKFENCDDMLLVVRDLYGAKG